MVFPPRWCKGKVLQAHGVDLVKVFDDDSHVVLFPLKTTEGKIAAGFFSIKKTVGEVFVPMIMVIRSQFK